MNKLYKLPIKASQFLTEETPSARSEQELQALESSLRKFFELSDEAKLDETVITFRIKLEDFLWQLFLTLPEPTAPLRLATHRKRLDNIAEKLQKTLDNEEPVQLDRKELDLIQNILQNDEKFSEMLIMFEVEVGPGIKHLKLPASNMALTQGFIEALSELYPQ